MESRIASTRPGVSLRATGATAHYIGGDRIGAREICKLQIVRYERSREVYLLYFDGDGEELTDTLHDDVEQALAQAEFEFGLTLDDWEFAVSEVKPA